MGPKELSQTLLPRLSQTLLPRLSQTLLPRLGQTLLSRLAPPKARPDSPPKARPDSAKARPDSPSSNHSMVCEFGPILLYNCALLLAELSLNSSVSLFGNSEGSASITES